MMRVLVVFVGLLFTASALTRTERNDILLNVIDPLLRNPPASIEVRPGDFRGALVRLIFHECGTWDPSKVGTNRGGCHACIQITNCTSCDFTASQNNGLQPVVNQINTVYRSASVQGRPLSQVLTLADFQILFGKRAVEAASGIPNLPYQWGRKDCPSARPAFASRLPPASIRDPFPLYMDIFETRLGLTTQQWVALMGAHSLGRMETANSGFEGEWESVEPNVMNNRYYNEMVNNDWARFTQPNGNKLWDLPNNNDGPLRNNQVPHQLDVDVGMFWRISDGVCQITRTTGTCPEENRIPGRSGGASLPTIMRNYASSNANFLTNFAAAWGRLTGLGGDTLQNVV